MGAGSSIGKSTAGSVQGSSIVKSSGSGERLGFFNSEEHWERGAPRVHQ